MPKPIANPTNPFKCDEIDWEGEPPPAELHVYEEHAKSIVSENDSPDLGFRHSVNPYRGCYHACAYCYARPTHQYIDFGAGTDFDRRIVAKVNAAELLRDAFNKKSWRGDTIVFSGVTDCYQPLEASYRLTRACLDVCAEYHNPVGVITKGAVIRRDIEVLAELHKVARAHVAISIPFADDETGRLIEPFASPISKRFETLRMISEAGIPTSVMVAPIIPGLNDSMMPEILERAHECGARNAGMVLLRLPREVLPVFDERIQKALPQRHEKIKSAILQMRKGKMNNADFGSRMRGEGARWNIIEDLFLTHTKRLGMNVEMREPAAPTFVRPTRQLALF